ncbi:MAG TPA: VWA domain-containing protein [Acidobacteriaceae bacterium]|jgi:Ca-activated chloride channel family protein
METISSTVPVFDHSFRVFCAKLCFAFSIILELLLIAGACSVTWAQSVGDGNTAVLDQHEVATAISPTAAVSHSSAKPLEINVDLVLIPVTVADAMNRPVLELSQRDFGLYDSGKRQDIKYFFAEAAPISIGLILDFSKSMENKIEREREAVVQFLNNANPEDDYFAIAVSSKPHLIADATDSLDDLQSSIQAKPPEGSTALLDSIAMGLARMRSAHYQRRALLIISDGGDNSSRYVLRNIKNLVRESDVDIYAIGLFDTAVFKTYEEFMGKRWLREITDGSAGHTVTVERVEKLPEAAAEISREMRQQYVLGYSPSDTAANGQWHKVKVQILSSTAEHPLTPFYKKGYYARSK